MWRRKFAPHYYCSKSLTKKWTRVTVRFHPGPPLELYMISCGGFRFSVQWSSTERKGTVWETERYRPKRNRAVKWTERDGPQTNRAGPREPVFNRHWTVPYCSFIKIPFSYHSLKKDRYLNSIEPFLTVPWSKGPVFERDEHRSIIVPWTVPLTKRNSIGTVLNRSNIGP